VSEPSCAHTNGSDVGKRGTVWVRVFTRPGSAFFIPDGTTVSEALSRTTHLGVGAHADDLEIMAIHGILACHLASDRSFTGAIVTDGVAAPTAGPTLDDEAIREVRRLEQKRAAELGRYGAVAFLDHPSSAVKDAADPRATDDLVELLRASHPDVVYTHALADSHDTHVAVALRLIDACRQLDPEERPARVLGCEVWRDLDWLDGADRVELPLDGHAELQAALIGVFTSQLGAGKRYDVAALGRRRAHAVFADARAADRHEGVVLAMDLTALAHGTGDPVGHARALLGRFSDDVTARLERLARRT
jgi:LmbE family N-acetylglucosaminyl deacetylase